MGPYISTCAFQLILIFLQLLFHPHEISAHCSQRAITPEILLITSKDPNGQQVFSEYVVPEDVKKFVLYCSYPQPIDWKFEGVMANTLVSVERGQTYQELLTWKNSCFYVALIFNGVQDQITGNYKCFSRANEKEVESVRVFSGNGRDGKPNLILQGKTLNITAELRQSVFNFPCAVNNPTTAVQLYYKGENEQTWVETPVGHTLLYNPTMGFFRVDMDDSLWGLYKCSIRGDSMEDDEKVVQIYLKKPPDFQATYSKDSSAVSVLNIPARVDTPFILICSGFFHVTIPTLKSIALQVDSEVLESFNASMPYPYESRILLKYTGRGEPVNTRGEVQCLKNETNEVLHTWRFKWTSPSPIGLELDNVKVTAKCNSAFLSDIEMTYISCETLTECQFKSKCLEDDADAINTCTGNNGAFQKLKTRELDETTIVGHLPQQSGAVRCHSPDVESIRFYFMSASGQGIAEDVKTTNDMIRVKVSPEKLEVGDKIGIECWLAERAFGAGPILTFTWKDDSVTQVPEEQIFNSTRTRQHGFLYLKATVQILSTQVTQLSCLGLFPEKTGSHRQNQDLIVEARSKVIDGDLEEAAVFSDGKPGNLTCSAMTFPLPSITWRTPPQAKPFVKFHEEDKEMRRISKLIFTKFDATLDGDFVCVVLDGNRTTEKKFTVNFIEVADSTGATVGIIIGVLLVLFLAIGIAIGFRYWERRKNDSLPMTVREPEEQDLSSPLTQKDIDEFIEGNQAAVAGSKDPYVIIQNSPYDTKYDILKEHLELDENKILGSGAYGMVMKGRMKGGEVKEARAVAVKTVKPNAEPAYIKSLLIELKVMIYVGKNNNVVDLVGACTENLVDKQLYIVLQLCQNGGLDSYLRNHRDVFVNQVERGRWVPSKIEQFAFILMYVNTTEGTLYTADLIRWSHQIANGMEYLATKKVIHGDLATRNVLLDENLVAKISDFGLARQMYEYTQYTKKQQAPLPWRWMSIESLRDMVFSTESDIWSFGITLWEIMTLAEVPYPGLTWNPTFITTLLEGYRMSKPKFAPSEMYDMMLDCWREKPVDRISFTDLKDKLLEVLETQFTAEYISI